MDQPDHPSQPPQPAAPAPPPTCPTAPPTPRASPSAARRRWRSTPRSPGSPSPSAPAAPTGAPRSTTSPAATTRSSTLVKPYGEAVEKLETGAFSVTPEINPKSRHERVRAYHGRVHLTATSPTSPRSASSPPASPTSTSPASTAPGGGCAPTRPPTAGPGSRRCGRRCSGPASTPEALGSRLVALTELADLEAEQGPLQPVAAATRGRSAFGGPADRDAVAALDLEPQRQTVYAHVNARFTITPPEL